MSLIMYEVLCAKNSFCTTVSVGNQDLWLPDIFLIGNRYAPRHFEEIIFDCGVCSLDSAPRCLFFCSPGRWLVSLREGPAQRSRGRGWGVTSYDSSQHRPGRPEMAWPLGSCALVCLSLPCKRSSLLKLDRPWGGASPLALDSALPSRTPGKPVHVLLHARRDAARTPVFLSVQHWRIL